MCLEATPIARIEILNCHFLSDMQMLIVLLYLRSEFSPKELFFDPESTKQICKKPFLFHKIKQNLNLIVCQNKDHVSNEVS